MTDQPNSTPEPGPLPQDFWPSAEAPPDATSSADRPTAPESLAGSSTDTAASVGKRNRPLFGTIFWGAVLLAFAAFMVVWTLQPGSPDPTLWLLGGVIVVGLLLVVAGIAAASRRAG